MKLMPRKTHCWPVLYTGSLEHNLGASMIPSESRKSLY
jgi:hypothetical protein